MINFPAIKPKSALSYEMDAADALRDADECRAKATVGYNLSGEPEYVAMMLNRAAQATSRAAKYAAKAAALRSAK